MGFLVQTAALDWLNLDSMVRTSLQNVSVLQDMARVVHDPPDLHDRVLCALGCLTTVSLFDSCPVVVTLERAIKAAFLPKMFASTGANVIQDVCVACSDPLKEAQHRLRHELTKRLMEEVFPNSVRTILTGKLRRWLSQWLPFADSFDYAESLIGRVSLIMRQLPLCVCSAVLKTWCNGWATSWRFQDRTVACKCGCLDLCRLIHISLICLP